MTNHIAVVLMEISYDSCSAHSEIELCCPQVVALRIAEMKTYGAKRGHVDKIHQLKIIKIRLRGKKSRDYTRDQPCIWTGYVVFG